MTIHYKSTAIEFFITIKKDINTKQNVTGIEKEKYQESLQEKERIA